MLYRLFLVLTLLLLLLGSSSCKQGQFKKDGAPANSGPVSEEQQVKDTVKKYMKAVEDEKAEVMWEMLSDARQKKFKEQGLAKNQFIKRANREINEAKKIQGKIIGLTFSRVKVKKSEATAEFTLERKMARQNKKYALEKTEDGWKIRNLSPH